MFPRSPVAYPASQKGLPTEPPSSWPLLGYVRRHPADNNQYPTTVETCDPATWTPTSSDWDEGRVQRWGLRMPANKDLFGGAEDLGAVLTKLSMENSNEKRLYMPTNRPDNFRTPTYQFIHVLEQRKRKAVAVDSDVNNVMEKSFVVKVELTNGAEAVWRRFRVPAATTLSVLHDQILVPIIGWARGYHGYVFEDPKDGSVFGPKRYAGYIDMMHSDMKYLYVADDRKFPLAGLIHNVGDVCYYTYDLGDDWEHKIILEEIVQCAPVGFGQRVEILAGECACPPEDGSGLAETSCKAFGEFVRKFRSDPISQMRVVEEVESTAMNYRTNAAGMRMPFHPLDYDLEYHAALLADVLNGPAVHKKNTDEFKESMRHCNMCQDRLKALKMCRQCEKVMYCSKKCQKADWAQHKKQCRAVRRAAQAKP